MSGREPMFTQSAAVLLLVLLCVSGLVTALILRESDGVPYITDNVETYSTHIHAGNMSQRGLGASLGLTDETYGRNPAGPSVIYTHQGNFPRLYMFLLNSLGVTTVRAQILATLVTVGLATIVLAFVFLLKATDLAFAFIALLCLVLNYVFFVQWQFDTYRIWHGFFTFAVLLCAHEVARGRWRGWAWACAPLFALCFYFETIFAVFLALLFAAYLVVQAWPSHGRIGKGLLGGAAGALIGAGVLTAQVVGYLGWAGFLRDLYYTYVLRNHSDPSYTGQLALLESFYRDHSVVYWYINEMSTSHLMLPVVLVATHLRASIALMPPVLILVTGLVLGGWATFVALNLLTNGKPVRALHQWIYQDHRIPRTILLPAIFWLMALAAPLVSIPVWALTLSTRSTPLVFVSFLPVTLLALALALGPRRLTEWLWTCSAAEEGGGRVIEPLVRVILAIALLILTPLLLIALSSWSWPRHPLSEFLHLAGLYRMGVPLIFGAVALGWWRRARLGQALRGFIGGLDQREDKLSRETRMAAGGLALCGMCGTVLTPILCGWLPTSALPLLLCLPIAVMMALFAYGRRARQAAPPRPGFSELRLGLVAAAWLVGAPLFALTLVPAVVSGRSGLTSVYLGCLLALGVMLAPRGLKFLSTTAHEVIDSFRTDREETLAVARNVSGRSLLFMALASPGLLLHQSYNPTILGRYSAGHILLLLGYVLYAGLLGVAYTSTFLAARGAKGWRWPATTLVSGVQVVWNIIFGPIKVVGLGILLVGAGARLLAGAWGLIVAGHAGPAPSKPATVRLASVIVAALVALLVTKRVTGSALGFARLKALNVFAVSVLALGLYGLSARHAELFGTEPGDLWGVLTNGGLPPWMCWGLVALSLWLMLDIGLDGSVLREPDGAPHALRKIGMLLACGVGAYVLVFLFAPGYIITAYLWRWSFFPTFLWILVFAMACYTLWQVGGRLVFDWGGAGRRRYGVLGPGLRVSLGILCLVLFMASLAVYGRTQMTFEKLLPPTHYAFLRMLDEEPYKGASFVVDNYAGPVASYTGEWAYFDPRFSAGEISLGPTGFVVARDMRHLWSSDRLTNAAYTKPTYFLCMRSQTPVIGAMLRNRRGDSYGCDRSPLAIRALADDGAAMHNRVVARDDVRNSWMIILLDWEFPPFLVAHPEENRWLRVSIDPDRGGKLGTQVKVEYQYAQQGGETEADTELQVYRVASRGPCEPRQNQRALLATAKGTRQVALPAGFSGSIVVSVIPHSVKKRGFEYFSEIIEIPASSHEPARACAYVPTPVNFINGYSVLEDDRLSARWNFVEYATEYFIEARSADGQWSWAAYENGWMNSVVIPVPAPDAEYWVHVTPCNGMACGARSEAIKAVPLPPGAAAMARPDDPSSAMSP